MIREVLQLGIKGQDLVKRTLKDIQKDKEKFAKKASFEFGKLQYKGAAEARSKFDLSDRDKSSLELLRAQRTAEAPQRELNYLRAQRESQSEEKIKKAIEGPMIAAQGASTLSGATTTKAMLEGVATALGGPVGMIAAKAGGMMIDASISFKDNVRSASMVFADTMEAENIQKNILGTGDFLSSRVDIDVNSKKALIEGLGQKFGKVSENNLKSINRIFGSSYQNSTDAKQAADLALGNFSALGTDKGYFMQKISDQFSTLPPSIKNELIASMRDMIPEEELFKQNDELARINAVALGDTADRERARQMVGEYDKDKKQYSNIQAAIDIQKLTNTMDTTLNRGMGAIVSKLDILIGTIANWGGGGVKGRQ